jgi:peptidoglycan/LPS O-acetylase OafA/YrhL
MQRHYSLDYLRAACILYLMGFWHLFEYTGIPGDLWANEITRRAATIVLALFCLISGFLCGRSKIDGIKGLAGYYVGRFWRLYPPFLLASFLFYLMEIDTPGKLLDGVLLITMFNKNAPRTLWFVDMLVMFYAIAPLFLWARDKVFTCLCVLAAVLAAAADYDLMTHLLDLRLMLFLPCFVTGILFAHKTPKLTLTLALVLAVLWGASLWLTTFISFEGLRDSPLQIPLGVVSAIILFLAAYAFLDKVKAPGVIGVISYASFFMYLFHRPLYKSIKPLLADLSVPVRTVVLICVVLPVLIGLAYGLQKAYDAVVKRLTPKRSAAAA